MLEELAARIHDIYMKEAHRQGDVRHAENYDELPEAIKEYDRVLAQWILMNWNPRFEPYGELPPA